MYPEDQLIPISALQHWLFCPRQYALIHLEQVWAENKFTAEGKVLHEKAHSGEDETREGIRVTRSLPVSSLSLGLAGQCDIVEFHADGAVFPVEYKRGRPKLHLADEIQLCAQALCLEDMLGISIASGALFYGKPRRRSPVAFDASLRDLTLSTLVDVRSCFASGVTPNACYDADRCDNCSLFDACQPRALRFKKGAASWFSSSLNHTPLD